MAATEMTRSCSTVWHPHIQHKRLFLLSSPKDVESKRLIVGFGRALSICGIGKPRMHVALLRCCSELREENQKKNIDIRNDFSIMVDVFNRSAFAKTVFRIGHTMCVIITRLDGELNGRGHLNRFNWRMETSEVNLKFLLLCRIELIWLDDFCFYYFYWEHKLSLLFAEFTADGLVHVVNANTLTPRWNLFFFAVIE